MATESKYTKTFTAGEALEQYRRVKFSTASRTQVEYADAGEKFIGITTEKVASGDPVTVRQWGAWATFLCTASEAAAIGADTYGADDGKVADTASGPKIGEFETAGTADGQWVEIRPQPEAISEFSELNDVGGNEALVLGATGSAVNHTQLTNAAAGGAPSVKAVGDDTNVSLELAGKGAGVAQVTSPLVHKATQTAETNTDTLTIAELLTKVIDGTPTSAATYTLPTAADLVAGIADCKVGDGFEFAINNKSAGANTITVAAGSGGTADGTLTVAQNVVRAFKVFVTNVTAESEAYCVYGIGA